jgi:hypothetical protein
MKRAALIIVLAVLGVTLARSAFRSGAAALQQPAEAPPSRFVPGGALLYLESRDFSALLAGWDRSSEKQFWLKSDNYEIFSRSRLFLRLKDANAEFSRAAGVPVGADLLRQLAGKQAALAIFDIGKLEFLFISRVPSASAMQSALWQTRSQFESREADGTQFFLRRDPESGREVAFAISGDYVILATREDLVAGALQLLSGHSASPSIESDPFWSQLLAAASTPGDLRMVLNLEKIVPSPYFRSYWIQQNISDLKQYSAAVSDLFLSSDQYREERVLIRKSSPPPEFSPNAPAADASAALRFAPDDAGFYEARANPAPAECVALLESKILSPAANSAAARPPQNAPEVPAAVNFGEDSDLETRIDQPPPANVVPSDNTDGLKTLFAKTPVSSVLWTHSTAQSPNGVFVQIHSGMAFLSASAWNEAEVREVFAQFMAPALTTGGLGTKWQPALDGVQAFNGLSPLAVAIRGNALLVSDDPQFVSKMLQSSRSVSTPSDPSVLIAGFNHQREKENFQRLTALVDHPSGAPTAGEAPNFFSGNIASLSSMFAPQSSQKIVVHDHGARVNQTVTYQWAR